MIALIKKEIRSFFSSPIGYLVIALFLIFNGLFLWVFNGNYNVFDAGFADLSSFFELAPWVLLFLIPAVTMRSFSEETKLGTLELLLTKPLGLRNIILGKYFGALLLIIIAIIPTLSYIITISKLGNPMGNWDVGSTMGSYVGLLFLALAYTAIGIFSSALSKNQIVSFIIAIFISFLLYFGFEGIADGSSLANFGMASHFKSMARGVIDTRDVIYFVSVSILFLTGTYLKLKKEA